MHLSRLCAQATTVKRAIEQRVPDMTNEVGAGGGLAKHATSLTAAPPPGTNKKWLRPGFGAAP